MPQRRIGIGRHLSRKQIQRGRRGLQLREMSRRITLVKRAIGHDLEPSLHGIAQLLQKGIRHRLGIVWIRPARKSEHRRKIGEAALDNARVCDFSKRPAIPE